MRGLLLTIGLAICARPLSAAVTLPELTSALATAGKTLSLDANRHGTITDAVGDVEVFAYMSDPKTPGLNQITLVQSYCPKTRTNPAQVSEWLANRHMGGSWTTFFAQVDGTVSAEALITIGPKATVEEVCAKVVEAKNAFASFQQEFAALPVPRNGIVSERDIDYDAKLFAADHRDMSILSHLWGWDFKGGYGFSTGLPWLMPISVDGTTVWVYPDKSYGPFAAITLSAEFKIPPKDPKMWLKKANDGIRWGQVSDQTRPGYFAYRANVEYRSGVTPRLLKSKIEEFVRKAKELQKSAGG